MINGLKTTAENTFWFTGLQGKEPSDLRASSDYAGRVQYHCGGNRCTMRITDLRESDSATYKFRLITNHIGGSYTAERGVSLTVSAIQVKIDKTEPCWSDPCSWSQLKCVSRCPLSGQTSFIWYENEKRVLKKTSQSWEKYFYSAESYSCAVQGLEDSLSPSVCGHGHSCHRVTYADRRICAFRGSSVEISSTFNSYENTVSKFWFRTDRSFQHFGEQPEDSGRIQVFETQKGRSTLRISDLRETDSAEYRFKFTTTRFEWQSRFPGTTLTVRDPDLQVQVIKSSSGPKLICHSSCIQGGRSPFTWFENGTKIMEQTSSSYRCSVDPAGVYSCSYEDYRSTSVYAPTAPTVLMIPTGDIMKNSSVTLNCSSDANPPPKYTWYKRNQSLLRGSQLVLDSVQSSDSAEYHCVADNNLGRRTSEHVFIDVKYGPQTAILTLNPSAEVAEGLPLTLNCSSDANPAATYTWYKANQILRHGPVNIYDFTSLSSEDKGIYSCKSENQYGHVSSAPLFLDVQYAPKPPSVSARPSAEIVEGRAVTLMCSSDANPAANYTWYKENEDSPLASGQIFSIADFSAKHSGNYYCEALNTRGRHNSTFISIIVADKRTAAAVGTVTALLLVIVLLIVFICIRRKQLKQQSTSRERRDNGEQSRTGPVYDNLSAVAQRRPPEQQDPLRNATISFFQDQVDVVYASVKPAHRRAQNRSTEDEVEYASVIPAHRRAQNRSTEDEVEYASIRIQTASRLPRANHEAGDDSFALYSTVKPR
ncbi:B-cell receptor CD22-like isoform X2 [Cheilinus undulatus]|nr:B-cell receptor CD22-like isoform X2 [Cheilinus undulatus]XP_041640769.1 B-cell receptor CD22-like isoform X2 [Cheilinus undulatus]